MADLTGNRPFGKLDAQGRLIPESFGDMAFLGAYVGTNLIYKGFARPGTAAAAAKWQIAKLTYDISNNLTAVQWPQDAAGNASSDYQFQWTARAGYTYS